MRIAYAIQNVGGIDFRRDVGDTVPVKHTLLGLREAGHQVSCLMLRGRSVVGFDNVNEHEKTWPVPSGITDTRTFKLFESVVRRVQRQLKLPYFALFDLLRFYGACRRTLPDYDLCHEHNGLFSAGAALACARLGIPYVLTVSSEPLRERALGGRPLKGLHKMIATWEARYTYKQARRIICVSEATKSYLAENWQVDPDKVIVMPNGVDSDLFHPDYDPKSVRAELGIRDEPTVGFVGGFQFWHGIEILVESFAELLNQVPNARLLLVGDGRARPAIEKKIDECGVGSAVIITGFLPQGKVPEMLAAIDVAVIPYPKLPQEMWFSPLKMFEYMAAGKAIVASRSGQIAEVIENGKDGVLVTPGDGAALTESMVSLIGDPVKRKQLGMNARQKAVREHSWDQYISKLERIYQSALTISKSGIDDG